MGGALRRLESPHEVASFSVELWPWECNSDHQNSSRNGANQQQSPISQKEPEEEEDKEAENDLISELPPELALTVLSKLNATDLCLAACVWQKLASDEILWQGLCREQWPVATVYSNEKKARSVGFRKIYLMLDEATLTFNSSAQEGMRYLFDNGLVSNNASEIASFFHCTRAKLSKTQIRHYLQIRSDVVECMMTLQNFAKKFLPNALRECFSRMEAPNDRGRYLHELLDSFSKRFCHCNPDLGYSVDSVYVMCFSLILLSVDLTSPHVKNKMSKREFIRNTRNAVVVDNVNVNNNNNNANANAAFVNNNNVVNNRRGSKSGDELFGQMYDNVFLKGHVSCEGDDAAARIRANQNQFVPGYLAMFL